MLLVRNRVHLLRHCVYCCSSCWRASRKLRRAAGLSPTSGMTSIVIAAGSPRTRSSSNRAAVGERSSGAGENRMVVVRATPSAPRYPKATEFRPTKGGWSCPGCTFCRVHPRTSNRSRKSASKSTRRRTVLLFRPKLVTLSCSSSESASRRFRETKMFSCDSNPWGSVTVTGYVSSTFCE